MTETGDPSVRRWSQLNEPQPRRGVAASTLNVIEANTRSVRPSVSLLVNPELRVALPVPGQQRRDDGDLVLGDLREQRLQARPDDQRS
jgi:hypothetical protein